MKMRTALSILLIGMIAGAMNAQDRTFKLSVDYAKFKGDAEHVYFEVYYGFDVSLLKYVPVNNAMQSEVMASVTFKRSSDDSIVARQAWRIPFSVTDTTMLKDIRLTSDLFGFYLKPDLYRMYIVVKDMNDPAVMDSITALADLKPIPVETVALSDVELSTSIHQIEKDVNNRFYKNTFEVKPNPSRLFGLHQPALFYYLEAYNLKSKQSEYYVTKAIITNAVGKEVINHEKTKKRVNDSNVEVGMIKVHSLRSGVYTFTYVVSDTVDRTQTTVSKKFFIYNPSLPKDTLVNPSAANIDATEYATMTEEDLNKQFEQSRYLASRNEADQFKKVTGVEAKRKLLYEFWRTRDEDPSTELNETKIDYFRRVETANNNYRTGFREGWKTDRGRIYIIYGAPDEVERHTNEVDVKPYEIWYYNSIQGGVQFIFGDRTGFSDFILLHSTHRNELRDDQWMRQLQTN